MDPSLPSTTNTTTTSAAPPQPPPPPPAHQNQYPPEPLTERVLRAFEHRLRLLHRSDSDFFILGATGNVYTVTVSAAPACTCPDRTTPCKHILFVYLRVLTVSLDDPCLWRRTLHPCQLTRLLSAPVAPDAVAGAAVRRRFHEMHRRRAATHPDGNPLPVAAEPGSMCPVCLEEMGGGGGDGRRLVACATCKNPIHEECLLTWKRSSRRRSTSCVICRARWRDLSEQERYINLSAYVSEDENDGEDYCGVNLIN